MSMLNRLFGKHTQQMVIHHDSEVSALLKQFYEYYSQFNEKLALFKELKETVVSIKSRIYQPALKSFRSLPLEEIKQIQAQLDEKLNALKAELRKIKESIRAEKTLEQREFYYFSKLSQFVDAELSRKGEYINKDFGPKYFAILGDLKENLFHFKRGTYGLAHLLAAQLHLLNDLEAAEAEIRTDFRKDSKMAMPRLIATSRILEVEIMRFGRYLEEESNIIHPEKTQLRGFLSDFSTLRTLGVVYSEPRVTKYNVGVISTRFKDFYGLKGIGIIHSDNKVEVRFVKGRSERHAEVVQMLFEGMPGMKLADDVAVRAYLHSLPPEKLIKIAGYEMQLQFDENKELKIANINYASTILTIQMERKKMVPALIRISKVDFERLNYTLLFSINKDLLDKKEFEMTIQEKGSKIVVVDKRIYPLLE